MGMRINNNVMAMNAYRQLAINSNNTSNPIEKLSSASRINKAGDDAAGLAISQKMRDQIKGLQNASRSMVSGDLQDGFISSPQTVGSNPDGVYATLQSMREQAMRASANMDTMVTKDREAIGAELEALQSEVQRISAQAEANTQRVMVGADSEPGEPQTDASAATWIIVDTSGALVSAGPEDVYADETLTAEEADAMAARVNDAISSVNDTRAKLGAIQNRLEHTIKNLDASSENLQTSESRVRDVDMAKEMVEFTKTNILNQAATAMLAQANQAPQAVLQLLR